LKGATSGGVRWDGGGGCKRGATPGRGFFRGPSEGRIRLRKRNEQRRRKVLALHRSQRTREESGKKEKKKVRGTLTRL